ncbi:MAG TPA: hypothetical protein VM689_23515 [Aliidongia sp.]|nr:hypothetical protein [Aliidongia sp.]
MHRFALLPLLALGSMLVGCTAEPTTADQQARLTPQLGVPQADPNVAPTGSRIKGAQPDPFSCTVTGYDFDKAPTNQTGPAIFHSANCGAFVDHR